MQDPNYLKKLQDAMMGIDDGDTMSPMQEDIVQESIDTAQAQKETVEDIANVTRDIAQAESSPEVTKNKIENTNEQAKSDHLKTKEERDPKSEYLKLIDEYKKRLNEKPEESTGDKVMNWLTGIGQGANVINKLYSRQNVPPIGEVEYWGDRSKKSQSSRKKEDLSGLQNLAKMYQNYQSMGKKGTSERKVYQTKSGLVEIGEDGKPREIYQDPSAKTYAEARKASQALSEKKFGAQEEMRDRLSDKEVKDITAFDDGMRIIDDIENLYQNTDVTSDLGPYASRMEEASRYVPFMERDTDFVKMQQLVGIQLADYVKSISGAQVSEQEAQRLLKNIPNMQDKPQAFKAKLQQFRKELSDARKDYLENIGLQKEGAKKFLGKEDESKTKSPYGDIVERKGKKYKWNPMVGKYQIYKGE